MAVFRCRKCKKAHAMTLSPGVVHKSVACSCGEVIRYSRLRAAVTLKTACIVSVWVALWGIYLYKSATAGWFASHPHVPRQLARLLVVGGGFAMGTAFAFYVYEDERDQAKRWKLAVVCGIRAVLTVAAAALFVSTAVKYH